MHRGHSLTASCLAAVLVFACGETTGPDGNPPPDPPPPPPPPPPPVVIDVLPPSMSFLPGQGSQLQFAVTVQNGDAADVTWTSSDPSIATVDDAGLMTVANGWGPVSITASLDGVSDSESVTVFHADGAGANPVMDETFVDFLGRWNMPGGVFAIVKEGRLVSMRAFGVADSTTGETMGPDHRFRISGISRAVTTAAIFRLIEDGLLTLDEPAFDRIPGLLPPGGPADARVLGITLRELLALKCGWDLSVTEGAFTRLREVATDRGVPSPPTHLDILGWILDRPLDFEPDTRGGYSNHCYLVAGLVLEEVSGMSYEDYVQAEVFSPLGITSARMSISRLPDRDGTEPFYYSSGQAQSPYDDLPGFVPLAYGGQTDFPLLWASGGWSMTAADLARFIVAVDGDPSNGELLAPSSVTEMLSDQGAGFGLGWGLLAGAHGYSGGAIGNTVLGWTVTGRTPDIDSDLFDTRYVVMINSRNEVDRSTFFNELIVETMFDTMETISNWGPQDLFGQF